MKNLNDSLQKLRNNIEFEQFKGYDPYDTLNSWIPFLSLGKWCAVLATQFQKRNPINIRPFLGIKKIHSAYGMGLLLKAYVKLFVLSENDDYIKSIIFIKDWLIKNRTPFEEELVWGYDYPYATPDFVNNKNYPTVVHHSFIIDALYEYYQVFKDPEIRNIIIKSGDFIIKHIPIIKTEEGVCFGYSPDSENCTYNASLHAARVLAIIQKLTGSQDNFNLIKEALNFVIAKQKNSGVWYYSMNTENGEERMQIDFHQGFILECLFDIKTMTGYSNEKLEQSIIKGLEFYKNEQFFSNGKSKWRLPKIFPVDIHNQGQGIITFSKLRRYQEDGLIFSKKILLWTIENMQSKKGHFYYRNYSNYKNKIPYMRWGQAIMLLAFSEYLEKIEVMNPK
ncbi:exopolysaccharide biosynthesis protein VpsJ [Lentimicrobium sp.]